MTKREIALLKKYRAVSEPGREAVRQLVRKLRTKLGE